MFKIKAREIQRDAAYIEVHAAALRGGRNRYPIFYEIISIGKGDISPALNCKSAANYRSSPLVKPLYDRPQNGKETSFIIFLSDILCIL